MALHFGWLFYCSKESAKNWDADKASQEVATTNAT